MYPGPPKSPQNHNKGHCSDGFKQKLTEGEFATWPQPATIFTTGSQFHPLPFLGFIREVYKQGVDPSCSDLTMEEEAFLSMLKGPGRVIQSNDRAVLFKLFAGFDIPSYDQTPKSLFTELNGIKYLHIDALRNTNVPVASTSSQM
jgi:hypothetical protein